MTENRFGGNSPRTLSGDVNRFDEAGIWYFHPSIFEYSTGPWQPALPPDPDLVKLWKQTIDWFADNGLKFMVLHFAPYGGDAYPSPINPDRVRFGWGYHYTIDFKNFPEARVFPEDFVRSNQDIVRTVTAYGKEKGVDIYFHHYNFLAPAPFVDAHPELTHMEFLRPGNFVDLHKGEGWSLKAGVNHYYDLCWNKPLYRQFMVACFEEFFETFPDAAGMLMTPGERARCRCIHCIGEHPSEERTASARYGDSPQKRKTIAHFCKVFYETMTRIGKRPLIRSWVSGILNAPDEWAAILPKGPTYVMKYSVFDMTDVGVDPLADAFLNKGHDLWLMKEYVGGENAGPMVMTVSESFDMVAENCRKKGIRNVMGVDNSEHGFQYKTRRVQYLPEILFANSFGKNRKGEPQELSLEYYKGIFGGKASEIFRAVEQYSELPYNISRLIWSHTEGYTWGHHTAFSGFGGQSRRGFGIGEGYVPPEWARREIVPLADYVEHLKDHPWDGKFRAEITGDGKDPLVFLEELTRKAKDAMGDLERLAPSVSAGAQDEMDLLVKSAELSYLTGLRWSHLFKARLLYAGAKSPAPEHVRKQLAHSAVAEFRKAMRAVKETRPILESYPPNLVDPRMAIRPQLGEEKARAFELELLEKDLSALLGADLPKPGP